MSAEKLSVADITHLYQSTLTFLCPLTYDLVLPLNMLNLSQINHLTQIRGDTAYGEEEGYSCRMLEERTVTQNSITIT